MFLEIPFEIAFNVSQDLDFNFIVISMFFIDILVSLNTAFYTRGNLVMERKVIMRNYLSKYFHIDILTIFVTFMIIAFQGFNIGFLQYFRFLFFANLRKFFKIHKTLDEKYKLYYRLQGVLEIIEQVFFSFFIIHVFACGFYGISSAQMAKGNKSWIAEEGLANASWPQKYLYAFYWSTITIMTVGYGDVVPKNDSEMVFAIMTAIVGCGVFAFNVSTIGRVFEKMNRDNEQFRFVE